MSPVTVGVGGGRDDPSGTVGRGTITPDTVGTSENPFGTVGAEDPSRYGWVGGAISPGTVGRDGRSLWYGWGNFFRQKNGILPQPNRILTPPSLTTRHSPLPRNYYCSNNFFIWKISDG